MMTSVIPHLRSRRTGIPEQPSTIPHLGGVAPTITVLTFRWILQGGLCLPLITAISVTTILQRDLFWDLDTISVPRSRPLGKEEGILTRPTLARQICRIYGQVYYSMARRGMSIDTRQWSFIHLGSRTVPLQQSIMVTQVTISFLRSRLRRLRSMRLPSQIPPIFLI